MSNGCYYTDEEIAEMEAQHEEVCQQVKFLKQAIHQIRTWVRLHRAGELSADGAFTQIDMDASRCLTEQR